MSERGEWVQTRTGTPFYLFDPRPEEVHIEDIAHALSHVARFGGHTPQHYSVAQHSVIVSRVCAPEDALWGLLHDAAEAYMGDIVRPLKRAVAGGVLYEIEEKIQAAIAARFGLSLPIPASVLEADERVLATEARDLMHCADPRSEGWMIDGDALPVVVSPWSTHVSFEAFRTRFFELTLSPTTPDAAGVQ